MPEKDTPLYGAKNCQPTIVLTDSPTLMTGAHEYISTGTEQLAGNFEGKIDETVPVSIVAAVPPSSDKRRNAKKGAKPVKEVDENENKHNPKLNSTPVYKPPTIQSICEARKCINVDICKEIVKLLESIKATNKTKIDDNTKEITNKALDLLDTTK